MPTENSESSEKSSFEDHRLNVAGMLKLVERSARRATVAY